MDGDFYSKYNFGEKNVLDSSIISYYFLLSTLATVGYGDYVPQTSRERLIAMIIMVTGIAFFSYVINNFNNIMKNYYTKLGHVNKIPELEEWMLSLSTFYFFKSLYLLHNCNR